jgi:hypothetical protein
MLPTNQHPPLKKPDYSRPPPLFSPHEMVDAVQSDKANHNKVDGDHVVQQARSNKDQNPGNERNDWRDMGGSEMHDDLRCKKKVAPIPG